MNNPAGAMIQAMAEQVLWPVCGHAGRHVLRSARPGAAFLGPNGAGKSTTMKLLTGFLAPSKERPRSAVSIWRSERLKAAEILGYLPENGPLYLEMTPSSILRFLGDSSRDGNPNAWTSDWNMSPANAALERCLGKADRQAVKRIPATCRHGPGSAARPPSLDSR